MEKKVIWSNCDLKLDDWIDCFKETNPDLTEEEYLQMMYEANDGNLDFVRDDLDKVVADSILVIADIGRWNGRVMGYKVIESGNLADCLYSDCDMAEWYIDEENEFKGHFVHHDGRNNCYYRIWKDDIEDENKEELLNLIYNGKATQEDIDNLTEKLGDTISKIYGW